MIALPGEVPFITVIQWAGYALILGIIIPIVFIKYKRRHYSKRVLCFFYLKTREVRQVFLEPNERNLLDWDKGFYIYNEDWINLTSHWLGGRVPALTYIENNPLPTNLKGYSSMALEATARQLSADFQDNAFKSFAEATDTNIKETITTQVRKDFVLMFIGMAVFMGIVTFALWSKLNSIAGS